MEVRVARTFPVTGAAEMSGGHLDSRTMAAGQTSESDRQHDGA